MDLKVWQGWNKIKKVPTIILTFKVLSNFPELVEKQYKTISSPTQYIQSPLGDTVEHTKSPPSLLPLANDLTIWNLIDKEYPFISRYTKIEGEIEFTLVTTNTYKKRN